MYTHDAGFLVFEGNHFRNGFMYKSFGMSAIIHDGVKPTLQELEKFEATPEEVEIEGVCTCVCACVSESACTSVYDFSENF